MDGERNAAHRMLEDDIAAQVLGIQLQRAAGGSATLTMTVTGEMVNGHYLAHGGYLFAFADTAFAAACNSHGGHRRLGRRGVVHHTSPRR